MKKTMVLSMSLGLGLVLAPAVRATSIPFSYTTTNLGQGSGTNHITETVSGETVTATAWSTTGASGSVFQTATLGQYSGLGLGVCNQVELATAKTGCTYPQHEVDDNGGQFDFVLFTFTTPVTSVTFNIVPVFPSDTNASYWAGNGINPGIETLASLGSVTNSNETTTDTARSITITGLGNGVNSVLFGASLSGTANYFKISSLSVTEATAAPEPATFGLAGIALIGFGVVRRKIRKSATL